MYKLSIEKETRLREDLPVLSESYEEYVLKKFRALSYFILKVCLEEHGDVLTISDYAQKVLLMEAVNIKIKASSYEDAYDEFLGYVNSFNSRLVEESYVGGTDSFIYTVEDPNVFLNTIFPKETSLKENFKN